MKLNLFNKKVRISNNSIMSQLIPSHYHGSTRSKHSILAILLALLTTTTTTTLIILTATITAEANSSSQAANNYIQRQTDATGRSQLMVAIHCEASSSVLYHSQFLDTESRKWRSDRDPSAYCTQDKKQILDYCRKVYPKHDIRNIVESSRVYKIDGWCKLGSSTRKCRTRLTVKPYRCLEGNFQSDALLVPERCLFDHVHNKSTCENPDQWNRTASENCHFKEMKLQSFAMLQPCGLDVFSGVEFVCCPLNSQQQSNDNKASTPKVSEGNSFAQAANGMLGWPKESKYDADEKYNTIKVDNDVIRKHHEGDSEEHEEASSQAVGDDDEDDEYELDEDEYDDDNSSWNGDEPSSTSTTSTTTTTTTTTTTERPIDHYLSHFDLAHEHEEFRNAELAVENSYKEKINHVMNDWRQLDGHYMELKKKDPQAAEEYKKRMTHQFQKTIEALEEEGQAQRHQLASMHAERAMAIINRRKKAAMDCLTQSLDKLPIRTRQVERCIIKLLKALEKDRSHTLRQYRNLLNLNTREALREKKIILDHLVTLNRAGNQSIAMLERSPVLVDKLKSRIIALWHKLRNIPLDEPIVRESELKIMEKYEEEVAQHKIELERQRLLEQEGSQDSSQEAAPVKVVSEVKEFNKPTTDETNLKSIKSNIQSPSVKELEPQPTTTSTLDPKRSPTSTKPQQSSVQTMSIQQQQQKLAHSVLTEEHDDMDNEIHHQLESAKYSHLKADPSHHELSYSIKHEPNDSRLRFGYSTFLISGCVVAVLLAIISFKYYSKHSARAYKCQGFAEVGRTCPDEKSVTSMQFNGYENPAYKFYEAEA